MNQILGSGSFPSGGHDGRYAAKLQELDNVLGFRSLVQTRHRQESRHTVLNTDVETLELQGWLFFVTQNALVGSGHAAMPVGNK